MRSRMFAIALLLVLLPIHVWSADAATTVGREQWNDTARQREVPVKIYKPIASEKPWPVVILSHGLGGSREALTYLGEHWASHGYFCVVLQHAGSDEALFRKLPLREGIENLKAAMTFEQLQQRCRDVSFAIDELTKLNAEKSLPLFGKLDLDRIAMAAGRAARFCDVLGCGGGRGAGRGAGQYRRAPSSVFGAAA